MNQTKDAEELLKLKGQIIDEPLLKKLYKAFNRKQKRMIKQEVL